MFRSLAGFTSQYHSLSLVVVSEFDEWKVLVYAPGMTIHGTRQFGEAKAKEHATVLARAYLQEEKHEDLPAAEQLEWTASSSQDWMIWRA